MLFRILFPLVKRSCDPNVFGLSVEYQHAGILRANVRRSSLSVLTAVVASAPSMSALP